MFEVTLFFQSRLVFRFGPTAFGHDLRVFHDRWEDPLIEPLEEEQRRDIEEHGRIVELSVNDQDEFCPLIGKPLLAVGELFYVHEIIGQERVGYAFHFAEDTVFYVANTADTVWVSRSVDPKVFGERLLCAAAAS